MPQMGLSAFMANPAVSNSLALMQQMGRQSEFPQAAGHAAGPLPGLQAGQYAMTPHMLLQPPHGGYSPMNTFLPPGAAGLVCCLWKPSMLHRHAARVISLY